MGPPVIGVFSTAKSFGFSAISDQYQLHYTFVCAQTACSNETNQMFAEILKQIAKNNCTHFLWKPETPSFAFYSQRKPNALTFDLLILKIESLFGLFTLEKKTLSNRCKKSVSRFKLIQSKRCEFTHEKVKVFF